MGTAVSVPLPSYKIVKYPIAFFKLFFVLNIPVAGCYFAELNSSAIRLPVGVRRVVEATESPRSVASLRAS
jgi:hypothetical protein